MHSVLVALAYLLTIPQGVPGIAPGTRCTEVRRFSELPHMIAGQVGFLTPSQIAEIDEPFNQSGSSDSKLPKARFFGACHADDLWLVAIEHGGREQTVILLSFDGFFSLGSRQLPIRQSFQQVLEALPEARHDGP